MTICARSAFGASFRRGFGPASGRDAAGAGRRSQPAKRRATKTGISSRSFRNPEYPPDIRARHRLRVALKNTAGRANEVIVFSLGMVSTGGCSRVGNEAFTHNTHVTRARGGAEWWLRPCWSPTSPQRGTRTPSALPDLGPLPTPPQRVITSSERDLYPTSGSIGAPASLATGE